MCRLKPLSGISRSARVDQLCRFAAAREPFCIPELKQEVLSGSRALHFSINEPLLDPRLPLLVQSAREACPQAYITIQSNGDLLTRENLDELIAAGISTVGVSAYDDATFAKVEPWQGSKLALLDMRRTPMASLENRAGSIELGRSINLPLKTPCYRPASMMVFKANGDSILCCADMYGDFVIGSILTESVAELWERQKVRSQQLVAGDRSATPCNQCDYSGAAPRAHFPR